MEHWNKTKRDKAPLFEESNNFKKKWQWFWSELKLLFNSKEIYSIAMENIRDINIKDYSPITPPKVFIDEIPISEKSEFTYPRPIPLLSEGDWVPEVTFPIGFSFLS